LEETTNQEGIFVSDVVQESPAQKAGIKPGDVVLRFNGRKVGDNEAFRQLVEETPPQTVVPLKVQRDGNLLNLTVQMGEAQPAWLAPLPNLDFTSLSRLSKLKDWNVSEGQLATGLDATTKQASEQAVNQLLEQYKKMFETQKAASAYNTTKMEKRMAELERQVEEYKQALELLRQELQEVKASQAP
jgi:membrane-associated protease RseP (regulator of RpoE activity)